MATPTRAIQFRDPQAMLELYEELDIPMFAVRYMGKNIFKVEDGDPGDARAMLGGFLDKMKQSGTTAIYELCLFKRVPEDGITDKTPTDYAWGFVLNDRDAMSGSSYGGHFGELLAEVKAMRKELNELKEGEKENSLGMVGEILEIEPLQPIIAAIGTRLAETIMGPAKVGELNRISGVPHVPAATWSEDVKVLRALNRLYPLCDELGDLLGKLADIAENKPKTFNFYVNMLKKMR